MQEEFGLPLFGQIAITMIVWIMHYSAILCIHVWLSILTSRCISHSFFFQCLLIWLQASCHFQVERASTNFHLLLFLRWCSSNNVMLTWALLLWRFMTYYIYILQGLVVLVHYNVIGNKKYKWLKKKWELEAESTSNFTEETARI